MSKISNQSRRWATGTVIALLAVFVLVISSALAANYDLTTTGSSATVNGAIFQQYGTGGGTGVIDSFLRVQNDGTEKGYNTNGALEFDTKGGGFTKSIKLSAVPQVNIGGTLYREFVLDTNESGGGNIYLDLEELQVFTATSGNLTGYVATPPGIGGGTSLIWRLDDGTNNTVNMRQFASGSGQTDYLFYVPDALFNGGPDCDYMDPAADCDVFVIFYNEFSSTDAGFEEWSTAIGGSLRPTIEVVKDIVPNDAPGAFNLQVNGATLAANVGDGGTTGPVPVVAGTSNNTVGETAGTGTNLAEYNTSIVCKTAAGATVASGQNAGPLTVPVGSTAHIVCTITNTFVGTPAIEVIKTANPGTILSGMDVTYTIEVKNTGNVPVTINSLVDNKFGNLDNKGSCIVPQTIPVGQSYTCTFTATLTDPSGVGFKHTNTVTACNTVPVVDLCANDDETVTILKPPAMEVLKTPDKDLLPYPGGDVVFTVTVNNTGGGDINLTSLMDNIYGNIASAANPKIKSTTCVLPQVIPAGPESQPGSYQCAFTANVTGAAGSDHKDVVTASGTGFNGVPLTDDDDAIVHIKDLPKIEVTKTANPTSVPETGGDVTYTFTVKNTGAIPATITALEDSVYGTLAGDADCAVGILLAPNATCSFDVLKTIAAGEAGSTHKNVFTATVEDEDGNEVSDNDDATVTRTDVKPSIVVTKTAAPTAIPETGGDVTFTFIVENNGEVTATISKLTDSKFGALAGDGDCQVGTALAAGASCTFDATFTLPAGKAGTTHTNVFTATAKDKEGNEATDTDDAVVTYTDVLPAIAVTKTANPTEVLQTGGDVEYTFVVQNTGTVPVTITSLTDSKFGTLAGDGNCQVGTVLAAGASCDFTATFPVPPGVVGSGHVNEFTAIAVDAEQNQATAKDDALVTYLDVLPSISVTKTANPTEVPETGGSVTFTFVVINNAKETATITSLVDSVFGPLAGDANCKVGTVLPVGGMCDFEATFNIPAGDYPGTHTNVFTAKAKDPDGTETTADDTEEVTYTDVLPDISVDKTADPTAVPETGGSVTFTFVVTNNGTEAATITSLADSKFGPLAGDGDCKVGTVLAAGGSCTFSAVFAVPAGKAGTEHVNVFTAKATDNDGNEDTAEDPATVVYNDVKPAILVTKTANPTSVPVAGGPVTFTYVVKNTGTVPVTITSLADDKFGPLAGDGDCKTGIVLAAGASCTFSAVFTVPAGAYPGEHVNLFTAKAVDAEQNEASTEDPETVVYQQPPITNVCPAGQYSNEWTDILGVGMGSNAWHSLQKKLVIPNASSVVDLYGQLAAKDQGKANYVRFYYPDNTYAQVNAPTSPAPQHWAVLWYGADLNPATDIRGRWFLQPWGAKQHMPRAFLLYPTYASTTTEYVNVFETLMTAETQVHWNITAGWIPKRVITIDIPAPLGPVTMNVELALVDNDSDTRPIYLTVEAGGVTQTVKPTKPNSGQQLNIHTFTLTNVPAGTDEIVITIESPAKYTDGLGALGGDSGALVGVTANYECVDIQLP